MVKIKDESLLVKSPMKGRGLDHTSPSKDGAASLEDDSSPKKNRLLDEKFTSIRESPRKRGQLEESNTPTKKVPSLMSTLSPCRASPSNGISKLSLDSPGKRLSSALDFSNVENNSSTKRTPKADSLATSTSDSLNSPRKRMSLSKKLSSPTKQKASSDSSLSVFDPVTEVQRLLRHRISQTNSPPSICGYERERRQIYDLIKRTGLTGESNSMLLIGPRGCGKSMLIKTVLEDVYMDEKIKQDLMLVQLNGLLQNDDRVALREITRQLKLENTVGDKVFGSFAETLQFLLEALKKGGKDSKPTLFILDEFDLFAQHRNQTLLYNLFDISQSAQAPICVIGVTCRLDVVELLEKRVKSRFSHRQIYLFNNLKLSQYRGLCYNYLSLPPDFQDKAFRDQWNDNIRTLLDEVAVKDVLERQFNLMNDVRGLLSLLTYPVCKISTSHPTITAADLITSFKLITTDTKSAMLHGVSILELAIIIAMKHLTDIYEGEPFNFEMVYSEYLKFARTRSGMQIYEKPIVMKAYEHLQSLELIRSHGGGAGTSRQKEYKLMTLLVHPAQIMDALQKYPNCPTEIKQWASQSIS